MDDGPGHDLAAALAASLADAREKHDDPRADLILEELVADAIGVVADGTDVVDLKLAAAAFGEMRRALAAFRAWGRGRPKVTAFGSARLEEGSAEYGLAREFGRRIAAEGYMVITGGGPGIMSAVVDGAGVANSFGVGIRLPFEQAPYPGLVGDPKLLQFKYFFTRKVFFLKEAAAVVMFPGGFGTHDEGFETLTLVQTGKSRLVPIVMLDVPGSTYWAEWERFVRGQLLARGLAGKDDAALWRVASDVDDAVREITGFYRVFHSMRTIRGTTVVRLRRDVPDDALPRLSDEFRDILGGQPIQRVPMAREEADEPATQALPRLSLAFDQKHFGRLRMLVDRLNDVGA